MAINHANALTLCSVLLLLLPVAVTAEDVRFPADAGVIDITKAPYNALADGKSDCTDALTKAFVDAASGKGNIVYLPNGTYVIRDTIRWAGKQKRNVLQGQSRDGTIIRLADHAEGFTDATKPRPMIWTGEFPPQRFRNAIRNVTIDAGRDNPGAIGLQFNASNQGQINTVHVRSGEGSGTIGLDMGFTGDVGPLLVKDLIVSGFNIGVYTSHSTASQTFEDLTLNDQREYGFVNNGQAIAIRSFISNNAVPALMNKRGSSLTTILNATFNGKGKAAELPAVINQAGLYIRDLKTPGYKSAIEGRDGVGEAALSTKQFLSHPVVTLFDSPQVALELPIEETPEVPWDDPAEWTSVRKYTPKEVWFDPSTGETLQAEPAEDSKAVKLLDWTDAIQEAIDSGATTIYFPYSKGNEYTMLGTVHLRNKVRRLIGMESAFGRIGKPQFVLDDGESDAVVLERFDWMYSRMMLTAVSKKRALAIKATLGAIHVMPGAKVFVEDAVCTFRIEKGGKLFARQFNTEYTSESKHDNLWRDMPWYDPKSKESNQKRPYLLVHPGNLNDGGTFWALGIKTEGDGTIVTTINGGKSEIMGGLIYANKNYNPDKKAFVVGEGSSLSISLGEWVIRKQPFNLVSETRNGETRLLKPGMSPRRGEGSLLVLMNAYPTTSPSTQPGVE